MIKHHEGGIEMAKILLKHGKDPEMRKKAEKLINEQQQDNKDFQSSMTHCLEMGGKHIEPAHFRLMMACAEACQTSAHFMLLNTPHHKHTCHECAEICEECATDCEIIGGMDECVQACRSCANSCRKMTA